MTPSKPDILAASAVWVAALLNVVPGLGTGYIYQRRWEAYWITSAVSTSWFVLGILLGPGSDPAAGAAAEPRSQLIGLAGLLVLAAVTAVEAALAALRARLD